VVRIDPCPCRSGRPVPATARAWPAYGSPLEPITPTSLRLFQLPSADGLAESFEADIRATSESSDRLRLVAERDGQLAGWLTAHLEHPAASAAHQLVRELGWIRLMVDALVVDQALGRQGTGTALLEAAESGGRGRGASMVRLDTYAHGPVAVPFYEQHMGYRRRSIYFAKELSCPG
jgi:GNAT superfamily N-acetyltransferase